MLYLYCLLPIATREGKRERALAPEPKEIAYRRKISNFVGNKFTDEFALVAKHRRRQRATSAMRSKRVVHPFPRSLARQTFSLFRND